MGALPSGSAAPKACIVQRSSRLRTRDGSKFSMRSVRSECSARPMKEIYLGDQCPRHNALFKDIAPRRWRILAQNIIDRWLRAHEPWRAIAVRLRIASLPISEIGIVKGVGRDQIANRSQPINGGAKAVVPGDWRMDPHLPVRHAHDRHARRKWQRQPKTAHPDLGTIDDPDPFREWFQGIERSIGEVGTFVHMNSHRVQGATRRIRIVVASRER